MKNIHRYEVLDGLRGVCALLVCILHARILSHLYDLDFIRNSYLFVDFFFVLSGFVICASYQNKIIEKKGFYKFTIKRIGRIWPLHILTLSVMVLIELCKYYILSQSSINSGSEAFVGRFSIESLISNIFLLHSIGLHESLTWNNPSWSISVEFFTYLVFALVVYWFRANIKNVAVTITLLSILILWALNPINMDVSYDYGMLRCLSGFFVGVCVYTLRNSRLTIGFYKASFIEFFAITATCFYIIHYGYNQFSLISPFVFGIMVWLFSYELGAFSYLLKFKYIQVLGKLSFTMYMIHSVLLTVIWRIVHLLNKGENELIIPSPISHGYKTIIDFGGRYMGDIMLVVYLAVVVFLSSIVYRFYEEPLRIKFNDIANKRF